MDDDDDKDEGTVDLPVCSAASRRRRRSDPGEEERRQTEMSNCISGGSHRHINRRRTSDRASLLSSAIW